MKKILAMVLTVSLVLSLCSCADSSSKSSGDNRGESIEQQEAVLEEAGEQQLQAARYSIGSAVITPDPNGITQVVYKPLGDAVFLELSDASGKVWRLDIPKNALPYGETVTMQLAGKIESDVLSGQLISGVILQPEGLQFIKPATLSVTGVNDGACLLSGTGTGAELNFYPSEVGGGTLTAEIQHFSSYTECMPSSDQQSKELTGTAQEAHDQALAKIKEFLKTPISAPPVPPDYEFRCKEEDGDNASSERNRSLDAYTASVMMPEMALLKQLMGAGQVVAQQGGETDDFYYAGLLVKRVLKKVDKLIATYQNDPDKLVPVANATNAIFRYAGDVGLEISAEPYMNALSAWMTRAADEQLRKIREEHDYKAMGAAVALIQESLTFNTDFGQSVDLSKEYLQKVKDAMTFTVDYEVSVYAGVQEQRMKLSGKTKLSWLDQNNEKVFTGKGEGKYLSYTHSGPGETTLVLPNAYPVNVRFKDFSPCTSETINVNVDVIGAETEVWTNPLFGTLTSGEDMYLFVNFIADELFQDYKDEDGGYTFPVPFENKRAQMGPESFTKTDTISYPEEGSAGGSITYTVTIKHTPK